VVQLRLDIGADLNDAAQNGKTAHSYQLITQLLLDKGANVHMTDNDNQTALHVAAKGGDEKIVEELLTRGAVLDAPSHWGTALAYAARVGRDAVVRVLLENNANLEVQGEHFGFVGTPLMPAVNGGYDSIVLQLLEKGANLHARHRCGQTALEFARIWRHDSTVSLLESWSPCSEEAQSNDTSGPVVYHFNQQGYRSRSPDGSTGTNNDTGRKRGRTEFETD